MASAAPPEEAAATKARIEKTLKRIVIPKVEFHETSLTDALRFLHNVTRQADPQGRGIAFISDIGTPLGPPNPASILFGDGEPEPGPEGVKITVTLTNIPASELLHYLAGLANAKFQIRSDGIHIANPWDPALFVTRKIRVPPDFFPAYEKQDHLDHTDVARHIRQDIGGFLLSYNIGRIKGATATLNANATVLTARNTEEELGFIADILESSRPPCVFPTYGIEVPKIIGHGENTALVRKLQRIVLPEVKFENTRLSAAVQILRDLSVRYDNESPKAKRGVKIILDGISPAPEHVPSPSAEKPDPREDPNVDYFTLPTPERELDYAATQITLLEALNVVAERGQWEISIGRSAVTLRKAGQTPSGHNTMTTWGYLIPPDDAAWVFGQAKVGRTYSEAARDLLIANGVIFPKGTSAIFDPHTSRLTLRNFEPQQTTAQNAVIRMWWGYYEAEKKKQAGR